MKRIFSALSVAVVVCMCGFNIAYATSPVATSSLSSKADIQALIVSLQTQLAQLQKKWAQIQQGSSTATSSQKMCIADVKVCSDGSFVSRDPSAGCAFRACPTGKETGATTPAQNMRIVITAPEVGETVSMGVGSDGNAVRYPIAYSVSGVKSFDGVEYKLELYKDANKLGHIGWPALRPVHMDSEFWEFSWDVGSYYNTRGDYSYATPGSGYRLKISLYVDEKLKATHEREISIIGSKDNKEIVVSSTASFTSPTSSVLIVAGKTEYIKWKISGNKDVTTLSSARIILWDTKLQKEANVLTEGAVNIFGNNVYAWKVPKTIDSGTYTLRLNFSQEKKGTSGASIPTTIESEPFNLLNTALPKVIVTSPTASSTALARRQFVVGWYLLGVLDSPKTTRIFIEKEGIRDEDVLISIDAKTDVRTRRNAYSFEWPNSYYEGRYRIRIECSFDKGADIIGYSEPFYQSK